MFDSVNIVQKLISLNEIIAVISHLLYLYIFTCNIFPDDNTECNRFFINSFTVKFKTKIKLNRTKKSSVREYTSDCHSYLSIDYM